MPLTNGDLIHGRYRIEARLGEGGMGAVYRAFDTLLDRPCALKQFSLGFLPSENETHLSDDGGATRLRSASKAPLVTREQAAEQFKREARLLARLDNPHLPKVTDYFSVDSDYFLAMTLIEGRDLAKVLEDAGRPLGEAQVLEWTSQAMDALEYCHAQGVIHRDVKPANIIVTPAGQVYLVDFGIAKPDDPGYKTVVGARGTTPGYSPLEQYGGRGRTDARTDIYALGATIYALLTGREPVESVDRASGVEMPAPEVSPGVRAALMKALAMVPAERFQSIAEMRAALAAGRDAGAPEVVLAAGRDAGAPAGKIVYGPVDGRLEHRGSGAISWHYVSLELRDFTAQVRFFNPYERAERGWDYGLGFRDTGTDNQYRLSVASNGEWQLVLATYDGVSKFATVAKGQVQGLDLAGGAANELRLVVKGAMGAFTVNGEFVASLDLSARELAGGVWVGTCFRRGHEIRGRATRFEGFTIWG